MMPAGSRSSSVDLMARLVSPPAPSPDRGDRRPDDPAEMIMQLVDNARAGDEEAIESMLNLATWREKPEVANLAMSALVGMWNAPQVNPDLQRRIAAQALQLFEFELGGEIWDAENGPPPDGAERTPRVTVPGPVLCLAARHAQAMGHGKLLEAIIEREPQAQPGRFFDDADLLGSSQLLSHLQVLRDSRGVGCPAIAHLESPEGPSWIQSAKEKVHLDRKPAVAFVHGDEHWVTLFVVPTADRGTRYLVFDSNRLPGRTSVGDQLVNALQVRGRVRSEDILLFGGNLQEGRAANACAPYSYGVAQEVDRLLGEKPDVAFNDIQACLAKCEREWAEMDLGPLGEFMRGMRAALTLGRTLPGEDAVAS